LLASDLEETDDHFIADLSVGTMVDFINFGPPVHGENVAKYNRLLDIENKLKINS
jgi:enolase